MKKIVIGREAYDKIMYYVNKAKFEISGFGNVQIIDGIPTVTDIILLKQENSSVETEMDGDAIAKAVYDHHVSGMEGELKFWWHSHVNMNVFWSGTDMKTINSLTENGWFIHGVFNKKYEYRCAYSNIEPVDIFMDDLEMEIDEAMVNSDNIIDIRLEIEALKEEIQKEIGAECDGKFDELVTDKPIIPYITQWKGHHRGSVMGKHHAAGTGTSQMATNQHTSTIPSSGVTTTGGSFEHLTLYDFWSMNNIRDPEGAFQLQNAGFNIEEITFMQDYCWVSDLEDVMWYEQTYMPIEEALKDMASVAI